MTRKLCVSSKKWDFFKLIPNEKFKKSFLPWIIIGSVYETRWNSLLGLSSIVPRRRRCIRMVFKKRWSIWLAIQSLFIRKPFLAVCVFFCNCYYIMVLAWAIFYMIESFKSFNGSGLPWLGNITLLHPFVMTSSILGCDNWWSSGKDCYIPEVANYTTECHPYVNFTETINGRKRYDLFSNYVRVWW